MSANRLPLFWAFAGGCLSGAVLIASWRADAEPSSTRARHSEARTPMFVAVAAADAEALHPPAATTPSVNEEKKAAEPSDTTPGEPGSSLADTLSRLEQSYREVLATAPQATRAHTPSPAALEPPEVPPPAPDTAPAPTVAASSAVAASSQAPPVAPVAVAVAPALNGPPVGAAPVPDSAPSEGPVALAAAEPSPQQVVMGDAQHNVFIGGANQGNVYQMQQQLVLLQYMQLMAVSPYAVASPYHARGLGGRVRAPAAPATGQRAWAVSAFPSSLTNTDNPWGFDFPPTVLVR